MVHGWVDVVRHQLLLQVCGRGAGLNSAFDSVGEDKLVGGRSAGVVLRMVVRLTA
jgi:hypothetical protein